MERRSLGKTGLEVSRLGFGCGNVGGLMVRGTPADQERGVARAMELGINYFDTAPSYGDGESERNLGRVLRALRAPVLVGTKFRIESNEHARVGEAVAASLEASLRRLGMERVDLLQLHNLIADGGTPGTVSARLVLEEVVPALERLRRQGKIRFFGITALGETAALRRVVGARVIDIAEDRFTMKHTVVSSRHAKIAAEGDGVIVMYDYRGGKKIAMPDEIRKRILTMEKK